MPISSTTALLHHNKGHRNKGHHNKGFTLLELMVVVAIMAVIAGATIMTSFGSGEDSIQQNSQIDAARFEMKEIKSALINYRTDIPIPPEDLIISAANFTFLFTGDNTWRPDYKTGWRGPYMRGGDDGFVDIGNSLTLDGTGAPHLITSSTHKLQRGIPDPFSFAAVENNVSTPSFANACAENTSNNLCLLDWRYVGQSDTDTPIKNYGRPYLLFNFVNKIESGDDEFNHYQARIVSMGPNGIYDSNSMGSNCINKFTTSGVNDDLVLCLN